MKVGVTGGAGFIGGNLCQRLLREPSIDQVHVIDDLSTGFRDNVPDGVTFSEGSIVDPATVASFVHGLDAVVHLAARPSVPRSIVDPVSAHEVNTIGTFNLLEAIRSHASQPHLVVASSSSVYGRNSALPKSEDLAPAPRNPYAATKLATEAYSLAWADAYGLDVLAFRFFNVFGPLQRAGHAYAAVVPAFLAAALAGEALPVHGDGSQTRDFTFVGTVADVLADAVVRRVRSDDALNLAFGSRVSLLELVAALESLLGQPFELEFGARRRGDVRDTQADTAAFRNLFPAIEPTSLTDGLRQTITWFRALS